MNTGLKVLGGVALIMVILFCGIGIWKLINENPKDEIITINSNPPNTKPKTTHPIQKPSIEPTIGGVIKVKKDDPIQAIYKPINKPSYMQEIRRPGKTYTSRVVGTVKGRASKADWGIKGDAYFTYIYGFKSEAKVIKNDGLEIVEERRFSHVVDKIMISDISLGIDLGDKLKYILDFLGTTVATNAYGGVPTPCPVGTMIDGKSIKIKDEWIKNAQDSGVFKQFPEIDPENLKKNFKMLSKKDGKLLLAGKTVRIKYIDGQGVQEIEPINCRLSEREIEIIKRTNYLMDHYVFPDKKVKPGDQWVVDGNIFAGLIDPEMSGKVMGKVGIIRQPDFSKEDGDNTKRLKIKRGEIIVRDDKGSNVIVGELTGLQGRLIIPDEYSVVTKAFIKGWADYKKISTNHLLFAAKMSVKPTFEIRYECEVSKTK